MTMMSGLSVAIGRGGKGMSCLPRLSKSFVGVRASMMIKPKAQTRALTARSFHTHYSSLLQIPLQEVQQPSLEGSHRMFHSEAEFHPVADETLDAIQDAMEELFEEIGGDDDLEVNCADGVLTLALPPHGTWVINKQTPNRQIWWSSPLSGPRRYEYEDGQWVFTRSMDSEEAPVTLGDSLVEEIRELYDVDLDIDI